MSRLTIGGVLLLSDSDSKRNRFLLLQWEKSLSLT